MEKEIIQDVLKEILDNKMSPNEFFTLFLHVQGKTIPKEINKDVYLTKLVKKGLLNTDGTATERLIDLNLFSNIDIEVNSLKTNVSNYRKLWPAMLLPSGKYARSDIKELEERFKWFFSNFDYDWLTVLEATDAYVKHYTERSFMYMKTSSYFIYKQDKSGVKISELAEWCDKSKNSDDILAQGYDINV